MYVIVKTTGNTEYFSMLATNGVFTDGDLRKAVIFSTSALATKQKEVLAALKPDETYAVKQIVLQNV